MSSASSAVTYTSIYTDSEPKRVFWGADEELSDGGSPRDIVYEYDGLLMQPIASSSLDYVTGPEHPPSHVEYRLVLVEDLEEEPAPTGDQSGPFAPPAPKTAKQLAARRNQERVKIILLLAIPDEYLLKFHNVADAKSLYEAIKSRFSGNVESKKMQKNVLKHQFEKFSTASNESLDKAYGR
ncbi:hypothetical protein Tco_1234500, partial [Tanacetum coccineum]